MHVAVETRVDRHGVGTHLHMALPIQTIGPRALADTYDALGLKRFNLGLDIA